MAAATVALPGGHKVGKKPLILASVGGAGFLAWRYMRAASSGAGAATSSDPYAGVAGLTGSSGQTDTSGTIAAGAGSTTPFGGPSGDVPTSNAAWVQQATAYLSSLGYDSAGAAAALGRYMAGQATTADRSLITTALGSLGAPPSGNYGYPVITPAPAPSSSSTPATTTPTPSSSSLPQGYGWFATGGKTYTLASIAQRYGISTSALVAMNPSLKGKSIAPVNTPIKVRTNASAWNQTAYKKVNHL